MQEVFEKIIKMLYENGVCSGNEESGFILLGKARQIVERVAAEYNNGWIPCSERLPSESECEKYEIQHPCHRQFMCTIKIKDSVQTRQLFYSKVFGWKYGPEDYNKYVIAWQPLPQPYEVLRRTLIDNNCSVALSKSGISVFNTAIYMQTGKFDGITVDINNLVKEEEKC